MFVLTVYQPIAMASVLIFCICCCCGFCCRCVSISVTNGTYGVDLLVCVVDRTSGRRVRRVFHERQKATPLLRVSASVLVLDYKCKVDVISQLERLTIAPPGHVNT